MKTFILLVSALAVGTTACSSDPTVTDAGDGPTVEIVMTDMAFTPAAIDVAGGETVTFRFRNDGSVPHEAVFGDLTEQVAHHEEMAAASSADHDMSNMSDMSDMSGEAGQSGEHSELHAIMLAPGQSIEVTHTFAEAGETMIGCHEPGHWEAGMRLDVSVT